MNKKVKNINIEYFTTLKTILNAQWISNILYQHLSSNEIYNRMNQLDGGIQNELFANQNCFIIDYDGTLHYQQLSKVDQELINPFMRVSLYKNSNISLKKSNFIELIDNHNLFNAYLVPEKLCLFAILSKLAVYNESNLKYQVESCLKSFSNNQRERNRNNSINNIALYGTQSALQSMFGMTSPSKTFVNTNHNLSLFESSGMSSKSLLT